MSSTLQFTPIRMPLIRPRLKVCSMMFLPACASARFHTPHSHRPRRIGAHKPAGAGEAPLFVRDNGFDLSDQTGTVQLLTAGLACALGTTAGGHARQHS